MGFTRKRPKIQNFLCLQGAQRRDPIIATNTTESAHAPSLRGAAGDEAISLYLRRILDATIERASKFEIVGSFYIREDFSERVEMALRIKALLSSRPGVPMVWTPLFQNPNRGEIKSVGKTKRSPYRE